MLEGSVVTLARDGGIKSAKGEMIQINTKNILFICGGIIILV